MFVKFIGLNFVFKNRKFSLKTNSFYFSFWMKNFAMHFDLDKRLKEACEKMQKLIESSGDNECINLVDLSQM